ncbi:MAG: hypothetical protein ACQETV_08810 [Actinomycetota bacterium]
MPRTLDDAVVAYAEAAHTEREAVEAELAGLLAELAATSRTAAALPQAERAALAAVATPADPADAAVGPSLRGALARRRMDASAVRLDDAARRLGISASAIRHVIGARTGGGTELLGCKDERGRWHVHAYQLPDEHGHGGQPASPAGRRAQRALPAGMEPLAVAAWWDAPNAGLLADEREWAPRGWLGTGGDPARLVEVAAAEGRD